MAASITKPGTETKIGPGFGSLGDWAGKPRGRSALTRLLASVAARCSSPPRSRHGKEASQVRRIRQTHYEMSLSLWSDRELRDSFQSMRRFAVADSKAAFFEEDLAIVFAIVDEALRRRLGAWKVFSDPQAGATAAPYSRQDTFDPKRENELPEKPLCKSLHTLMGEEQTGGDGLEIANPPHPNPLPPGERGHAHPDPCPPGEGGYAHPVPCQPGEGCNAQAFPSVVLEGMELVRSTGRGRFGSDALLPSEFYRALRVADSSNRYTFLATDEQLLAGLHLVRGRIVEMQAGEGKTAAIAFAAAAHAVSGRSVHILTGNDYLAERDCRIMAPVFRSLGLSAGVILESLEPDERRAAYQCDIVYGTLREFGFDFLRDNVTTSLDEQVQPCLDVAIVDEADQALIDEASIPLIISGEPSVGFIPVARVDRSVREMIALQEAEGQTWASALDTLVPRDREYGTRICQAMMAMPSSRELLNLSVKYPRAYRRGMDAIFLDSPNFPGEEWVKDLYFFVDLERRFVTLTEKGLDFLEAKFGSLGGNFAGKEAEKTGSGQLSRSDMRRLALANQIFQSLRAHLLLERGLDYVVAEESVLLLDRYTGRIRPESTYRYGLQSALEAKEFVPVQPDRESLAQISAQGFARRYRFLSGITGTAMPAAREFERRFGLKTVVVPTSQPIQRIDLPGRIYESNDVLLDAVVAEVARCQELGQPVLVGVRSVEQCEAMSQRLTKEGVAHQVLNALQSEWEEDIVRAAGKAGAVTVATNMAGRGTDIILSSKLASEITGRCIQVIRERLKAGKLRLTLSVHTGREADLLESSLGDALDLSMIRIDGHGMITFDVAPADPGTVLSPAEDTTDCLTVGLGLHVVSTQFNRHPRVAMQQRGRSGRQGGFGSSRVLLSLEDQQLFPPGTNIRRLKGCESRDPASHFCWQGPAVQEYLREQENRAEIEAEVARGLTNDFIAVSDLHTAAYYKLRRKCLGAESLLKEISAIAREAAEGLVAAHFPELDTSQYQTRFAALREAASEQFAIDVSDLHGTSLFRLPALVADRIGQRLQLIQSQMGCEDFSEFARRLFIECGDEAWRFHQAHLHETVQATQASIYGHKAAVADYILLADGLWEEFRASCRKAFLGRLLNLSDQWQEREAKESRRETVDEEELLRLIA